MKTIERRTHYVILDADRARFTRFVGSSVSLCTTPAEIAKIYDENSANVTWVTWTRKYVDELLKTVTRLWSEGHRFQPGRMDRVLTIAVPRTESIPTLHGLFNHIVGDSSEYRWLAKEELSEVLFDPTTDRMEHFIAAASDSVTRTVSLIRGDCRQLVLPFSLFEPSGDGTTPDFLRTRVTDFGRTIAFGPYEAAADAILYEVDAEYRKKMNQRRKAAEKTFGASLYRLRKQKKLRRSEFSPLSAKTIARIERNEIGKPHSKTLQTIADRLGLPAEEVGRF